jgi:hypothetical protein
MSFLKKVENYIYSTTYYYKSYKFHETSLEVIDCISIHSFHGQREPKIIFDTLDVNPKITLDVLNASLRRKFSQESFISLEVRIVETTFCYR